MREHSVTIAVFCGNYPGLQECAALLEQCGVKAVLNMTDSQLLPLHSCRVDNYSLSDSLSALCCRLMRKRLCGEEAEGSPDDCNRK